MTVSVEAFKNSMAHLAGGVVIVTTSAEGGRARGMTATAVCSVSLEPPLVMACMHRSAKTHGALERSGVFALNVLPARAKELAARFASNRTDKFEGVSTTVGDTGAPILLDALAHCECTVERTVDAGDHTIFIGRVVGAGGSDHADPRPLLYFRGDYGSIASLEEVDGHTSDGDASETGR